MPSMEITLIDVCYLIGGVLQLSLLNVVAYRMGYRGAWLIGPWIVGVVLVIIVAIGTFTAAAQAYVDVPLGWFLVRQIPASMTLPAFATLVYLAAKGQRRASTPVAAAATETL